MHIRSIPDPSRLDSTLLFVEEGQILLRFRVDVLNPDNTLNEVRYGLDGPGGTGDFRLVVIR